MTRWNRPRCYHRWTDPRTLIPVQPLFAAALYTARLARHRRQSLLRPLWHNRRWPLRQQPGRSRWPPCQPARTGTTGEVGPTRQTLDPPPPVRTPGCPNVDRACVADSGHTTDSGQRHWRPNVRGGVESRSSCPRRCLSCPCLYLSRKTW